jgi:hypothetical protein
MQFILGFYSPFWKKVPQAVSFGSQTCITPYTNIFTAHWSSAGETEDTTSWRLSSDCVQHTDYYYTPYPLRHLISKQVPYCIHKIPPLVPKHSQAKKSRPYHPTSIRSVFILSSNLCLSKYIIQLKNQHRWTQTSDTQGISCIAETSSLQKWKTGKYRKLLWSDSLFSKNIQGTDRKTIMPI